MVNKKNTLALQDIQLYIESINFNGFVDRKTHVIRIDSRAFIM